MKLKVHQRIELKFQGETFISRVEDIEGDKVCLGVPYSHGKDTYLRVGDEVLITFAGLVAAYRFVTTVVGVEFSPVAVFYIKIPENVERIQQREYVRVEVKLPCSYKRTGETSTADSVTVDISGGGLRFSAASDFEPGTRLELSVDLKAFRLKVAAEVIRTIKGDNKKFDVCVKFFEPDEKMIDKLISWIFSYQLELRKKGLI